MLKPSAAIKGCATVIMLMILGACRQDQPATQPAGSGPIRVFVSIPPQKYFVERVGGRRVAVSVLLAPGQSPHTYEPTPKQMVALSETQIYFRIGLPFERQIVAKIGAALAGLTMVDTCQGIELRPMEESCGEEEGERAGHHHEADEHGRDPHVWMNPRLVKIQAGTIGRALGRIDPAGRDEYERNYRAFAADLDALDAQIAAALAPLRGREFFVYHPAYGYFADAYGLKQVAVEVAGKQPAARQLAELTERAGKSGVKLIFVQPQSARRNAEALAGQIGGAVVPLDPLAENYLDNLRQMAELIQKALTSAASRPDHP